MKIKTNECISFICIYSLQFAVLLQQASYYQFFHLSDAYKTFNLIVFILCCVMIVVIKKNRLILISKSQKLSLILTLYMLGIGIAYGNTSHQLYWAVIDFVIYFLLLIPFRALNEKYTNQIIIAQYILFWISLLMYLYAKFNYSFYTSGEHSSTMFPFMLLPFTGLMKKKRYFFAALLGMLLLGFLESSRTIFAMTALILLFNLFNVYRRGHGIKGLLIIMMLFTILGIITVYLYEFALNYTGYSFIVKTIDAGDSHRIELYKVVFKQYQSNSIIEQIFGCGFMGSITTNSYRFMAHNDFIEMLYCYGLIGLVIFILWIISIYRELHRSVLMIESKSIITTGFIILLSLCTTNNVYFNFGAVVFLHVFLIFACSYKIRMKDRIFK